MRAGRRRSDSLSHSPRSLTWWAAPAAAAAEIEKQCNKGKERRQNKAPIFPVGLVTLNDASARSDIVENPLNTEQAAAADYDCKFDLRYKGIEALRLHAASAAAYGLTSCV